jgi:hypothetical protein
MFLSPRYRVFFEGGLNVFTLEHVAWVLVLNGVGLFLTWLEVIQSSASLLAQTGQSSFRVAVFAWKSLLGDCTISDNWVCSPRASSEVWHIQLHSQPHVSWEERWTTPKFVYWVAVLGSQGNGALRGWRLYPVHSFHMDVLS